MNDKPVSTAQSAKDARKAKRKEILEWIYAYTFIVISTTALVLTIVWWDWK